MVIPDLGFGVRCPDCGFDAEQDFSYCPRCGYSYLRQASSTPIKPKNGISPLLIIIIVVIVVVVFIAPLLMYVMVIGFGSDSDNNQMTPKASIIRMPVADGYKFTLTPPTIPTSWTDVTITMDGPVSATFDTISGPALTGTPPTTQQMTTDDLWLNVTDLDGDGQISGNDFFTITGFMPAGGTYTVTLTHEPTMGVMARNTFTT